ncbi:MAG: Maf family protein [Candidatus Acidiferrales bacterium]
MSTFPKLILASTSPRRAEILRNGGFDFEVFPSEIDESRSSRESAPVYVWRVAELKVRTAMSRLRANRQKDYSAIVAADTVVAVDGDVLGKPRSAEDARRMLRRLSGKWHEVFTGLAVLVRRSERTIVVVEKTRVEFGLLSDSEIDEYIRTDEPFDKAGAYAIQGQGGKFILRVEGCYFNVMGLPLARLYAILRELKLQ